MNCDCIKNVETKMKENGYPEAKILNQGFIFSTGKMTLNLECEYRENKKDGTPKAKKSIINMLCSYCPFCGKSTKPEEPNAN